MFGWQAALGLALAVSLGSAQTDLPDPPEFNVDDDPGIKAEARKIQEWTQDHQAKVATWYSDQKKELVALRTQEMLKFEEHLRNMKCVEMKHQLLKKMAEATAQARTLHQRRTEASEKAEAVRVSSELLSKVGASPKGKELRLGEQLHERQQRDGAAWLSAMETSNPAWQRRMRERMERRMQSDPNWRAHMQSDQGDGGRSWRQHVTYLDNAPQLDNNPPVSLLETEETSTEPLLKEADVAAIESLGKGKPAPKKDVETLIYHQDVQQRNWIRKREKEMIAFRKRAAEQVQEQQSVKQGEQAVLRGHRDSLIKCGRDRSWMSAKITQTIVKLPLPEMEKVEVEHPLVQQMEAWLECQRCAKPTGGAPGLPASPWP